MRSVDVGEAARSFMAILKAAESGEEILITRAGQPIAKLVKTASDQPGAKPDDPAKPRMRSIGWRDHP